MTFSRVGMPEWDYSHIFSFRQQVFIAPTTSLMPDSVLISHKNTTYWIYPCWYGLNCYKCSKNDENCPLIDPIIHENNLTIENSQNLRDPTRQNPHGDSRNTPEVHVSVTLPVDKTENTKIFHQSNTNNYYQSTYIIRLNRNTSF